MNLFTDKLFWYDIRFYHWYERLSFLLPKHPSWPYNALRYFPGGNYIWEHIVSVAIFSTTLNVTLTDGGTAVIVPSAISLTLGNGNVLGHNAVIIKTKTSVVNNSFATAVCKRKVVLNHFNQLIVDFKGSYSLLLRAYNDGVAYRFVISTNKPVVIKDEETNFNFPADQYAYVPFVRDIRNKDVYRSSFEALYQYQKLSSFTKYSLALTPVLVDLDKTKKAAIMEAEIFADGVNANRMLPIIKKQW